MHVTLFFITLGLLWARPRTNWKSHFWLAYVVALFTISSVGNGLQFKLAEMIWIDDRNYPGGPSAYAVTGSHNSVAIVGNAVYIANTWLQDGLLVRATMPSVALSLTRLFTNQLYRFWIIFGHSYAAVLVPTLMFLAAVGMFLPCLSAWRSEQIHSPRLRTDIYDLQPRTDALDCSLDIYSVLVDLGFLQHRRHHRHCRPAFGHAASHQARYHCHDPLCLGGCHAHRIGVLVLDHGSSPHHHLRAQQPGAEVGAPSPRAGPGQRVALSVLLLCLTSVEQSIAPLLIIMRVAQGRAWSADTFTTTTPSISFQTHGKGTAGDSYALSSRPAQGGVSTQVETITFSDSSATRLDDKPGAV